jgi:hypothetical protein
LRGEVWKSTGIRREVDINDKLAYNEVIDLLKNRKPFI